MMFPCVVFARQLKLEQRGAIANGADAKIFLKVHDDKGGAVTNASVRIATYMPTGEYSLYGKTDTNGVCVVKVKTNGFYLDFLVGKEGYYGTRKRISFLKIGEEHEVKEGKWQPYGSTENIELRKIRAPTHLSVAFMREFNNTKTIGSWVGFDLEKRDFVSPVGKGNVSDFEVLFEWDGRRFADYRGMSMKLRFTDEFSGYYQCDVNANSEFKGPYAASSGMSYLQNADFFERVIINEEAGWKDYERKFFDESKCWVVRSRCEVDAEGNLVSAHYSVVHNIEFGYERKGGICLCVTGAFNPVPNDTNLEDFETAERARHFIHQCEPPPWN